ncbi:CLN3 protein-domain-containing protein [Lineolata rhizophorae]|uniref:Protein BTN n=1 Tax=Lineolata rhizophorae TaxID=578093 RepID=A0A6A6P987_9PEZI|nr:CLN3 protein-domain-containing protein [Lineolata rhizophorae]
MLPMPGSPGATWALYRARLKAVFEGADPRVCAAFWFFGAFLARREPERAALQRKQRDAKPSFAIEAPASREKAPLRARAHPATLPTYPNRSPYAVRCRARSLINNVLYVIILSAALDLVGPDFPKGLVLLFDVVPSFATKLVAPYFIHHVPYSVRVLVFVALSTCGMLLIALTPSSQPPAADGDTATHTLLVAESGSAIASRMCGVALASLSSGGGELSFLGLTHYYGPFSLAAWGSGTGAAGLGGAGAYVLATTTIGLGVRTSLLAFSFLPVVMLVSFFVVLPRGPLRLERPAPAARPGGYERVEGDEDDDARSEDGSDLGGEVSARAESAEAQGERDTLLGTSLRSSSGRSFDDATAKAKRRGGDGGAGLLSGFRANLRRARHLFLPYMLPLLLVYVAEYTINQGVAPTLLFPLAASPFSSYRAFYPAYAAVYQAGVFVSRSSTPFVRVHALYAPALLQVANLALLAAHALFFFIPSVWPVFAVVFWEGLLGGLVYVSTFAEISEKVPLAEREFSLAATSVSDSAGICVAGFVAMAVEVAIFFEDVSILEMVDPYASKWQRPQYYSLLTGLDF